MLKKIKIAIFASGGGSNAKQIMAYFKGHEHIAVTLLIGNKKEIGAFKVAEAFGIKHLLISKDDLNNATTTLQILNNEQIDFIVLAGFLWLIPSYLIEAFPNKILNIHPSLLPKFGGRGMYGHFVHEAVKANNETISGMTIHFVNHHYDEGNIIFQAQCELSSSDTAEDIAAKVLALEHKYYAPTIEKVILDSTQG